MSPPRRRGFWLQVRMHPHERAQLQALAARMGMGASELVRRLIAGAVARMGLDRPAGRP